jgi:ankyrin repeat protein
MDILEPRLLTPVHDAIRDKASVTSILSLASLHGVILRDSDGRSPLHVAASCGRADVITALATESSSTTLDAQDDGGMTPLQSAVAAGHLAAIRALLDAGAQADARSSAGRTALHYTKGRHEVLTLLLSACRQVSPVDELGHTPLHRAAAQGQTVIVTSLIEAGAALNLADKTGRTPLHAACDEAREDVAVALIIAGACAEAVDGDGKTPLAYFQDPKARARLIAAAVKANPKLIPL